MSDGPGQADGGGSEKDQGRSPPVGFNEPVPCSLGGCGGRPRMTASCGFHEGLSGGEFLGVIFVRSRIPLLCGLGLGFDLFADPLETLSGLACTGEGHSMPGTRVGRCSVGPPRQCGIGLRLLLVAGQINAVTSFGRCGYQPRPHRVR